MKKPFSYKLNIFFFLLPALVLFIGVLIAPIIMSTYYSFHNWNGFATPEFIGFKNYVELFTSKSINIMRALKNAMLLAVFSCFIQLPFALWLALRLARGVRGGRFFLSVFFMPVLISTVIIGRLWMNIYDPGKAGILNAGLRALGIDQWLFPWISSKITSSKLAFTGQWTGFRETALGAAFVPILWQYIGYHMLLMYAGIKGVPPELLEAAELDGCTEGQVNRHIIIPYIKPILKVSVIFAVTGSLKSFDLIYALMKDTTKAELPSTLMYKLLFLHNRYGLGSAIAVILIALCFIFALLITLAFRDKGEKVA